MAPLDGLEDEGVEVGRSREVGLGQRLFHFLDFYQTQGPVLAWVGKRTHQRRSALIRYAALWPTQLSSSQGLRTTLSYFM